MAIESVHDDIDSNRRQRLLSQGSIEDRVAALEQIVFSTVDRDKLPDALKRNIKKIEDAEKDHPERDD